MPRGPILASVLVVRTWSACREQQAVDETTATGDVGSGAPARAVEQRSLGRRLTAISARFRRTAASENPPRRAGLCQCQRYLETGRRRHELRGARPTGTGRVLPTALLGCRSACCSRAGVDIDGSPTLLGTTRFPARRYGLPHRLRPHSCGRDKPRATAPKPSRCPWKAIG